MIFSTQAAVSLLSYWLLVALLIIYLPALVRRTKLDNKIDAHMQNIIRGFLIATLLLNVVSVLASVVTEYVAQLAHHL